MNEENNSNEEKNIKVLEAISDVQAALKAGIPKDHKNAVQGYNFRGIDDIYDVVGPLLPEHGLLILPRMLSRECEIHKNQKGTTMFHVVVKAEYTFKSKIDGSHEVVEMYGEAMDSSDKATNKAMSAAYKYACIQTFSIPVTGEPDADAESPEVPVDENAQEQVGPTPRAKPPVPAQKTPPRAPQRQETASEDIIPWRGHLLEVNPVPSKNDKGPYTKYVITFQLSDGEIKECVTFKEDKGTEAQFWPEDDEVIARVQPSIRYPGKFQFLGLEKIQPELVE